MAMWPAPGFCNGFDHLGGGAPALFGGLAYVPLVQLGSCLGQELSAGGVVLLSSHAFLVRKDTRQAPGAFVPGA